MKTFSPKVTIFAILSASSSRALTFPSAGYLMENGYEIDFIKVLPYNPDNEPITNACIAAPTIKKEETWIAHPFRIWRTARAC
jgi:hypothetical protein